MFIIQRPEPRTSGFTLIEFLVVIGMLAILLAIVLLAVNPARQFAQSRDTKRKSDINSLLNAIHGYMADNADGAAPSAIPVLPAAAGEVSDAGVDLCADIVPRYMAAMPRDPGGPGNPVAHYTDCTDYNTRYTVVRSTTANGGRVTVSAPNTELVTPDITETR